jgi:FtsH-binding integral membrane protein
MFVFWALFKRDVPALMLGLLAFGGVAFYTGLSHFLPRYMVQFYPAMVLMASLQLFAWLRRKSL